MLTLGEMGLGEYVKLGCEGLPGNGQPIFQVGSRLAGFVGLEPLDKSPKTQYVAGTGVTRVPVCPACKTPKERCPCPTARYYDLARPDSVGVKHDQEKSRVDLLSGPFLLELGKIMGHGSVKYGARNWLHVEKIRYIAAAGRHYFQYLGGEAVDKDSGVSHLVCCAANLMILWEKDQRAKDAPQEV